MIDASAAYDTEHAKSVRTPIYRVAIRQQAVTAPTGYWKIDEASGSRADSAGSNTLTDNNTVTSTTGKISNAGQFTRANSEYLNCVIGGGNALQLGNVDFTVYGWVYADSLPADMAIAGQWNGGSSRSWLLTYSSGDTAFKFWVYNGTTAVSVTSVVPVISTWYFIVVWRDSRSINIQVNNGSIATFSTAVYAQSSTDDFRLGAYDSSGVTAFWNGRIDEVGFVNGTALPAAERTRLYNGGSALALASYNPDPVYVCTSRPIGSEDLGTEIMEPISLDRRVEIENCRFPLSVLTFVLRDIDNAATDIVSDGIKGLRCDFYAGFWDIASSGNLTQMFGGIITEVEYESGVYRVTARSYMAAANDKVIFSGAQTRLTADITSTDTTVNVADTSAFETPAAAPSTAIKLILIDNEILSVRGKTATSFTSVIRATGAGGSLGYPVPPVVPISTAHSSGAFVKELIKVGEISVATADAATDDTMHPIEIIKSITQQTGKSGIGESYIPLNTTELDAAKATLGAQLQFRAVYAEGANAKQVLEGIYLDCAMYPTEDEQGRLGAKLYQSVSAATSVDTIEDGDITVFPRWLHNAQKAVNAVIYHYDYMPTTQEYTSTFVYRDDVKIAAIGREITLEIFSKFIRSQYSQSVPVALTWFEATAAFLTDAAQRHIARFGNTAPVISASTLLSKNLLEVGDDIEATFSQVVNLADATQTITDEPMEIAAMHHDFQASSLEIELLGYPDA